MTWRPELLRQPALALSAVADARLRRPGGPHHDLRGRTEIEHAGWFTREELQARLEAAEVGLPGASSIAPRMIPTWRDGPLAAP